MVNNQSLSEQDENSQPSFSEIELSCGVHILDSQDIVCREGIIYARPLSEHSVLTIAKLSDETSEKQTTENIQNTLVLATQHEISMHLVGAWSVEAISMSEIATLFTFLDYQAECRGIEKAEVNLPNNILLQTSNHFAIKLEEAPKSFREFILVSSLDSQDRRLDCLFSFIRKVESYWISHFLLSQVMSKNKEQDLDKIYNACQVYGVSESYFRKLCQRAFTRGPKKQIRLWRAAISALQLIEKDFSIATVAGSNGYSSSSHLSSELKSFFGFTPKEFKKLEGLLND